MRLAPTGLLGPALLDFSTSVDINVAATGYNNAYGDIRPGTPLLASGTDFDLTANVSNWGEADLVYVTSQQAAVVLPGTLVVIDKNWRISPTGASEANTGRPVAVALTAFQIGSVTEQGGWMLRRGICPVRYAVAATAGRVFGGTAGQATPTAAAGVQISNAICLTGSAATFTRSGVTRSGSSMVKFGNVGGMFVGQAISGTGIPASSVISAINPDGVSVIIGSAVGTPVNATATGTVTVTLTNTGYGICKVSYPAFQTQIT